MAFEKALVPILLHISHREESECANQDETNASNTQVLYINYSQVIDENLFPDLLNHLANAFLSKDYDRFWNVVKCSFEILEELKKGNQFRTSYFMTDKYVFQEVRDRVSGKKNISYHPGSGNIVCVSVLFNNEVDPTGDMRRKMFDFVREDEEEYECEISDKEKETQDSSVIDDLPSDAEEEIDEGVQATPERPCYYPSQIEMARILKNRIETIMEHHNNISSLSKAFDDVEFVVYTARYRMLSDQTEKRIFHPDAGVLSRKELETRDEENRKKRMFMYVRSTENDTHFEQLRERVHEKPKTLFIVIADECHWGITKGKDQKASAHNLFINEWCKYNSPRNLVVVQISATPFNLLTQNSRLPEVKCVILSDKISTTQKDYAAGDLLVLDREPELKEKVREISKEVELHVVHWSEVELKNFERGMRLKLKSTLTNKDAIYWYLRVSPHGELVVTDVEDKATNFIVKGSYGIVTIKATVEGQVVTITRDKSGTLEAKVDPPQPTKFEVKLDFGVGVAAFSLWDNEDHYLAVNKLGHVNLQPAKVVRQSGVSIMKPKHDLDGVSFEFYIDHCGPEEVDSAGQRYMSLNYYLSTINCCEKNDQKIRQDTFFQRIVDQAKREKKLSKAGSSSLTIDALLCAEYCYYVLHVSTYDSDDKIRQVLTTGNCKSPAAQLDKEIDSFIAQLKENTNCIQAEAFELVRTELRKKVKQDFRNDFKQLVAMKKKETSKGEEQDLQKLDELVTSFVACLMHLSQQDLQNVIQETHHASTVEDIKQILQMNDCQKMVEIWNRIVEERETSLLVKNLIHSGRHKSGKMKIVRARSMETADQFFYTLRLARKMAFQEECFEIIRDYGSIQIEKQLMKSSSPFFQKLQPDDCQGKFDCRCTKLNLHPGRKKCIDCDHVHKSITQYEDLENLACVLILVDKGRMGDTFPQSFDCLDLRLSYDSSREFKAGSKVFLSTVIQELGRMCRYAKVSVGESRVQNTPYVLVGRELFKKLETSVKTSPAISAISCTGADRYMTNSKRKEMPTSKNKEKTSSSLRWLSYEAQKDSYDYENEQKHRNRILLQAEPQIGKTGTYLCLIKHLRQDILGKENVSSRTTTSFDEGSFYLFENGDYLEDPPVNNDNERQDWQFPYWRTIQESPSLHDRKVVSGKYSIGGRFYTHDIVENPYVLMKREGQKPTKSGYHYQKTNCIVGERAWHWYHFEHCAECGRLLQGKEPVLETVKVNIDGKELIVKCSIPASSRPYVNLREQLTNSASTRPHCPEAVNNVPSLAYWIFHPSHRDDPRKCLLNYHHVMQKENHVASYIQVAVARSEKFQAYRSTWGKVLAIFQLPDALPDCKVGPSEGGIGYARRFIQKIASSLELEYVFVIDDNLAVMSEAVFSSSEHSQTMSSENIERDENGVIRMQRCSFLRPLMYLQEIVEGKNIPPDGEYESHPLKEQFEAQQLPLYSYTGPAKLFGDKKHESYGVLGLLRSVPKVVRPFAKTQVFAAVLLNVKSSVEKEVFYRPWPCWEDLRFNDDCDKAGLWVVKCNRFHFHKVQYNDWIEGLACPSIFQWTENSKLEERPTASELPQDLEESIILEHLRKTVNNEGQDNCFKGQIGYTDTQNSDTAVCPTKLLEKLEIRDYTDQALIPTLILSYCASDPNIKTLEMLEHLYCKVKEKILFVTSAEEASEEWYDMTLAFMQSKRGICFSKVMRDKVATFAIFSAADPRRHKLRWITIEATFREQDLQNQKLNETSDNKTSSEASSTQEISEARGDGDAGASEESLESAVNEKRNSERSVEKYAEDPKEKASVNQKKRKQNSTSSSSQLVFNTDAIEGPTNKRLKVQECISNSITANSTVKVTPVTSAQGTSVEVMIKTNKHEISLASQSHYMVEMPNGENTRAREAGIASPEQERENAFTEAFLQCTEHLASKSEAKSRHQEDASGDCCTASDDQQKPGKQRDPVKSSITGLKIDDPAYDEGANDVTKTIVALWREKKKQADDKDIDTKRVESELKDKKVTELQKVDSKGYTALIKACSLPSVGLHVVSYLIERNVNVNSKLPFSFITTDAAAKCLTPGMSALSVAIRRGNVRCVSTFMSRKKDIKFWKKDCDGNTALHHCVFSRAKGAFETLFPFFQQWKNEKGKTWKDLRNKKNKNAYQTALEEMRQVNIKKKSQAKNALEFMLNQMDPSGQWKDQLGKLFFSELIFIYLLRIKEKGLHPSGWKCYQIHYLLERFSIECRK